MAIGSHPAQGIGRTYGWMILFVLGALLALSVVIVVWLSDGAREFELDTGVSWSEFATAYPGVAATYILSQRLMFLCFAVVALYALIITYFGFRPGHRWAWFAMWLLPAMLALITFLTAQSRRPEIGTLYAGFALLIVVVLLLSIPRLFGKQVLSERAIA